MKVGCPFITCAVKKRGIEFCWQCEDQATCEKWARHREAGQSHDSFVCYQQLEHNISIVKRAGLTAFIRDQKARETILRTMLAEFNEGRSKSYFCIAATVMEVEEMKEAITEARNNSMGMDLKGKSKKLHELLDSCAEKRRCTLRLR
jgi:hypothetical protein